MEKVIECEETAGPSSDSMIKEKEERPDDDAKNGAEFNDSVESDDDVESGDDESGDESALQSSEPRVKVPDHYKKYPEYVTKIDAVHVKFVSSGIDVEKQEEYPVEVSYPYFGDHERLFGYKGLKITLYYADTSMCFHPNIEYESRIENHVEENVKADDIIVKFGSQLHQSHTDVMYSTYPSFKEHLKKQNFQPFGIFYSRIYFDNDKEMHIYRAEVSKECSTKFEKYLTAVQAFSMWYIIGSQYTDITDDRWVHYFIYEVNRKKDLSYTYKFGGFASIMNFYHYPDLIRPRIAQFLLSPKYSGRGNGAKFLQGIYDDLLASLRVKDITVELPSAKFQLMRDYVDCCNCRKLEEFSAENLLKGFSAKFVEVAENRFKIHKKQARRVYEILRFMVTDKNDESSLKNYRLEVKRRLNSPFVRSSKQLERLKKVLNEREFALVMESEKPEIKNRKLQQLYDLEIEEYTEVIERILKYQGKNLATG